MWCVNYIIKSLFQDKNNIKLFEKNSERKTFTKPIPRKHHFVIAKFRLLKELKEWNKFRNYLPSVNLSLNLWLFWYLLLTVAPLLSRTLSSIPWVKPVLSPGLLFLMTYISDWKTYSFVCQSPLYYYWYCYNKKHSSVGLLQKKYSSKFRKI